MAEALYRKYRPQIFEDVVGQEHIERTLKNAIKADKVSHAYLFTGPRGTGKTTTARLLAKALLCERGPTDEPDGTCEDCRLVAEGEHPDVYELDAASRTGVENVREEIIGRVNYAPTRGRYKVYIIDEVHMLSTAAFNALLKTLEEPPDHVVFVLCTTDPQKVPETIHSRCQRFDFRRISNDQLVSRLGAICEMEGVPFEGDALDLIAHRAQGGMRDALTSLEQLIAFGEGSITTELAERLLGSMDSSDLSQIVEAVGKRDVAAAFRWTSEYVESGADLAHIANDLAEHMRNMYVMSLTDADVPLEIGEAARRELQTELAWFGPDRLANVLAVLGDLIAELKTSTNQRLAFEITLTRLMRPESDLTLTALAERLEALERGGAGVAATPAPAAAVPAVAQPQPVQPASRQPFSQVQAGAAAEGAAQAAMQAGAQAARPTGLDAAGAAEAAPKRAAAESVAAPVAAAESAPLPPQADVAATAPAASFVRSSGESADVAVPQSGRTIDANAFPNMWNVALAHLKKTAAAFGVLFINARASYEAAANRVLIEFSADNDFAFQAAQKPEVRTALAEALARAGAPGLAFEIVQAQAVAGAPAASGAAPVSAASTVPAASASALQPVASSVAEMHAAQNVQVVPEMRSASAESAAEYAASDSAVPQAPRSDYDSGYVPDYDEVPFELYDEMQGYGVPAGDSFAGATPANDSASDQVSSPTASSVSAPASAQPAVDAATQPSPQLDPQTGQVVTEPTPDDLNSALAAAFGEGLTFEEI